MQIPGLHAWRCGPACGSLPRVKVKDDPTPPSEAEELETGVASRNLFEGLIADESPDVKEDIEKQIELDAAEEEIVVFENGEVNEEVDEGEEGEEGEPAAESELEESLEEAA